MAKLIDLVSASSASALATAVNTAIGTIETGSGAVSARLQQHL